MAFLTYSDISSRVAPFTQAEVEGQLAIVKNQLSNLGLDFDGYTLQTKSFYPDTNGTQIFFTGWFTTVTGVFIKNTGFSKEVLDYKKIPHTNLPTLYRGIDLSNTSCQPNIVYPDYYLEVTAHFGFLEDVPADLKEAIISWINRRLTFGSNSNQNISSSKVGDSTVTYESNPELSTPNPSITQDLEFISVLNYYIC